MFVRLKDFTLYCGACDGPMIQHYEMNSREYFLRCFDQKCEEYNRAYKLPTIPVERFVIEAEVEKDNGMDAVTSGTGKRDQTSEGLRNGEDDGSEGQNGEVGEGEVSL